MSTGSVTIVTWSYAVTKLCSGVMMYYCIVLYCNVMYFSLVQTFRIENVNYTGVSEIIINNITIIIDRGTWGLCFLLIGSLASLYYINQGIYKHTENHIKQEKRRKMTPGGSDKTVMDTQGYCIVLYHDNHMTVP